MGKQSVNISQDTTVMQGTCFGYEDKLTCMYRPEGSVTILVIYLCAEHLAMKNLSLRLAMSLAYLRVLAFHAG